MRSPTCLLESRVYSSKNLRSTVQKDFYNTICHKLPRADAANEAAIVRLFHHLVGAGEQRLWHFKAERLGCFNVDPQLVFRRCLHRQVGGYFTIRGGLISTGVIRSSLTDARPATSIACFLAFQAHPITTDERTIPSAAADAGSRPSLGRRR